jgi:hypothetical protein
MPFALTLDALSDFEPVGELKHRRLHLGCDLLFASGFFGTRFIGFALAKLLCFLVGGLCDLAGTNAASASANESSSPSRGMGNLPVRTMRRAKPVSLSSVRASIHRDLF